MHTVAVKVLAAVVAAVCFAKFRGISERFRLKKTAASCEIDPNIQTLIINCRVSKLKNLSPGTIFINNNLHAQQYI